MKTLIFLRTSTGTVSINDFERENGPVPLSSKTIQK